MSSTTIAPGRESTARKATLRKLVAGAALVAAVPVPVALATATPAEATTTRYNCTVSPLAPTIGPWVRVYRNGQWQRDRRVYFSTRVHCPKDRIIAIQDQRWEQDSGPDQYLGRMYNPYYLRTFAGAGTLTLSPWTWASQMNTESGSEEYYHRVSFKVATINGASSWTSWDYSAVTSG